MRVYEIIGEDAAGLIKPSAAPKGDRNQTKLPRSPKRGRWQTPPAQAPATPETPKLAASAASKPVA